MRRLSGSLDKLRSAGFAQGQQPLLTQALLSAVPHDLTLSALKAGSLGAPGSVVACAAALLDDYPRGGHCAECPSDLHAVSNGVFVGPRQQELLRKLNQLCYSPTVLSGYRSIPYQALLFAIHYLSGTLFDPAGRLTVAPPGESEHNYLDRALDIADSNLFMLHLFLLDEAPCSLSRPYLSGQIMALEPWHWRCEWSAESTGAGPFAQTRPRPDIKDLIAKIIGEDSPAGQAEHLFASGMGRLGASKCIGSRQETLALSIEDAVAGVGQGWDLYYLTIPRGYTPVMDNQILDRDVGRCLFRVDVRNDASQSFFTGNSAVAHRILSPSAIMDELLIKAGSPEPEDFRLHKSRTFELVRLADDSLIPAAYGVPCSPFERPCDIPRLIVDDYIGWLTACLPFGGPIYWSQDYCRSYVMHADPMRYAMLLDHLARLSDVLPPEAETVIGQLSTQYASDRALEPLMSGGAQEKDEIPEATVVFLTSALAQQSRHEEADALWRVNHARIRAYTEAALRNPHDPNGWLFLGHLCDFLRRRPRLGMAASPELPVLGAALDPVLERRFDSPVYAAAFAQMLALAIEADRAGAAKMAEDFLTFLIGYPEATSEHELGAVAGLETFQTSLYLEALITLATVQPLAEGDLALVRSRLLSGQAFLRRLQFVSACGIPTPNPNLLNGAVRFSLIDHHFRMDYGLHCLNVATGLAKLQR